MNETEGIRINFDPDQMDEEETFHFVGRVEDVSISPEGETVSGTKRTGEPYTFVRKRDQMTLAIRPIDGWEPPGEDGLVYAYYPLHRRGTKGAKNTLWGLFCLALKEIGIKPQTPEDLIGVPIEWEVYRSLEIGGYEHRNVKLPVRLAEEYTDDDTVVPKSTKKASPSVPSKGTSDKAGTSSEGLPDDVAEELADLLENGVTKLKLRRFARAHKVPFEDVMSEVEDLLESGDIKFSDGMYIVNI